MPYHCDSCKTELTNDFYLGRAQGAIRTSRVCTLPCASNWEASQPEPATWTWKPLSEWVAEYWKGMEKHPLYSIPSDDTRLWRYMDLPRSLAMLESGALYLPAIDRLDDPYEGSVTPGTLELLLTEAKKISKRMKEHGLKKREDILIARLLMNNPDWTRRWTFVSCWHENDFESAAMWTLYGDKTALAVTSTVGKLRKVVERHYDPSNPPVISSVRYIDFNADVVNTDYPMSCFLYKRKSYDHEKELRVLIQRFPHQEIPEIQIKSGEFIPGIPLKVNLSELIESVYLSPTMPDWQADLIGKVSAKYGLSAPVLQSRLNNPEDVIR